jgi:transcriptional regulator with XRE-family HTH domain
MDKEKTGRLIREARKKKNYTQTELGDLLGVTNKAVSRWEKGEAFPDVGILEELANLLGLRIADLVTGEVRNEETDREEAMAELVRLSRIQARERRKKIAVSLIPAVILLVDLAVGALAMNGADSILIINIRWTCMALMVLTMGFLLYESTVLGKEPSGELWLDRVWDIVPLTTLFVILLVFGWTIVGTQRGQNPFGLEDYQVGPFLMGWLWVMCVVNLTLLIVSGVLWAKGMMGVRPGQILSVTALFTGALFGNALHQMTTWEDAVRTLLLGGACLLLITVLTLILLAKISASRR